MMEQNQYAILASVATYCFFVIIALMIYFPYLKRKSYPDNSIDKDESRKFLQGLIAL